MFVIKAWGSRLSGCRQWRGCGHKSQPWGICPLWRKPQRPQQCRPACSCCTPWPPAAAGAGLSPHVPAYVLCVVSGIVQHGQAEYQRVLMFCFSLRLIFAHTYGSTHVARVCHLLPAVHRFRARYPDAADGCHAPGFAQMWRVCWVPKQHLKAGCLSR